MIRKVRLFPMIRRAALALLLVPLPALAQPGVPAPAAAPAPPAGPSYADLADLALAAPVAAHVRLRRALPLKPAEAAGVAPGFTRFYIEADIVALIRGEAGMPTQVSYLIDLPNEGRGRPARPAKKSEWLIFARTVPGRPGELQLTARDAQLPFSAAAAERTRAILREALAPDAAAALIGIGRAFHVPGVLPGASETQIFLLADSGRPLTTTVPVSDGRLVVLQTPTSQPVSLTIRREPGQAPTWFVSLSEFVDAGATRPPPDSLLWYRLACFLPDQLPPASLTEAPEHEAAIQADYRLVREELGACVRTRGRR